MTNQTEKSRSKASRLVTIVPHTHWDREWYAPFQTFRLRLVELMDGLLDLMESDPSYSFFHLDGQMAMVDDYLEVRPENEGRIRELAASGRLAFGPWYVLMDEFLVSAETIVRNLQIGVERSTAFGGPVEVGYLPDMFGHIAQMPQLLEQAGIADAVVWRGVPAAIHDTAFVWEALDGSRVRAQYLVAGYSDAGSVPREGRALVRRVVAHEQALAKYLDRAESGTPAAPAPLLFMNGGDHQVPQPWLGRVVREANSLQDEFEFEISTIAAALEKADAARPQGELECWHGELRSGARSNLLMGVASNRIDVKQAAARTERALERYAEPLAALFLEKGRYPHAELDIAWKEVVRNAAHDSICACSHDEVAEAVLARYATARQIADGITERVRGELAIGFAEPGHVVVNTSHRTRSATVELVVPGRELPEGAQLLRSGSGLDLALTLSSEELRGVLGQIEGDRVRDDYVTGVDVTEDDAEISVTVQLGPHRNADLHVDEIRRDLLARTAMRPETPIKVRLDQPATMRVLARVDDVPGLGWRAWSPAPLRHPVSVESGAATVSLTNGLVTASVSEVDGTYSLDGLPGFGRLVDSGDEGDTYNYSPPERDLVVDTPTSVAVRVLEEGPVRAIVEIVRTYRIPTHIDDAVRARVGESDVSVVCRVELHAGESFVRVTTTFDNRCRDHRLRVELPPPVRVRSARSGSSSAASMPKEGRASARSRPTPHGVSCRRGGSRSATTGCSSTSSSISRSTARGRAPRGWPASWR
jgi:hypothetical protein